jgi:hypothetical protein
MNFVAPRIACSELARPPLRGEEDAPPEHLHTVWYNPPINLDLVACFEPLDYSCPFISPHGLRIARHSFPAIHFSIPGDEVGAWWVFANPADRDDTMDLLLRSFPTALV